MRYFSLAVSSPNTVYQLMSYNNQLPVVHVYSNISQTLLLQKNVGVLKQIWLNEIIGVMLLMCQNTIVQVYGAYIKNILRFMFRNV